MILQYLSPENVAPLFVRVILGILFFMQGYEKIFKIKMPVVLQTIKPSYNNLHLPLYITTAAAYFTSYAELVCGILLLVGLFKVFAYYILALDLVIVSFGMSMVASIWDMSNVFPRILLLIFLLVYPLHYDLFDISHLLNYLFNFQIA